MKKNLRILLAAFFLILPSVSYGTDLIDMDIGFLDSIFDEPPADTPQEETRQAEETPSIIDSLRKRGIEFDFSYTLRGAVNPGWIGLYPWEEKAGEKFSLAPAVSMTSSIGINTQITNSFRVKTEVVMEIPGAGAIGSADFSIIPNITLGDFYFDYIFFNWVFMRAGKFEQPWGISPNYSFANLLSRVPAGGPSGSSYLLKFDVPIGAGGIQLLTQTRANIAGGELPEFESIGFGGKLNLAFKWADFNIGAFYQGNMATRAFLTARTTLWDFEIYSEWLLAVNTHSDNNISFACNFGFLKSFFNNKFDVNAEFFYNGEGVPDFSRTGAENDMYGLSPFPGGINAALNLLYRFSGWGNIRLFTRFLYGGSSFSVTPGIRITPFPNIEVYFAVPIAVGNGYYKNDAVNYSGEIKPFSFLLYITLRGSVRANYYF